MVVANDVVEALRVRERDVSLGVVEFSYKVEFSLDDFN